MEDNHQTQAHDQSTLTGNATHFDQNAIDAAEAAAVSQSDQQLEARGDESSLVSQQGVRARRVMTMKAFYPDIDWIMREVVGKGKGFQTLVGRLYGKVRDCERTVTKWQEKELESVRLDGVFESVALLTGEVARCTSLYLPMAFAEQIELALHANPGALVDIDIDIGLEATGKTIPYEWVVFSHIDGKMEEALRGMRNRRPTRLAPAALARLTASGSTH